MSSGAAPAKKRPPIVFKHRAAQTPSKDAAQTPGAPDAGTDSVALFRRAKEFFPLVFEETKREKELLQRRRQRQRQEQQDEQKQREASRESDAGEVKEEGSGRRKLSGAKRRKVSHELAPESSRRRDPSPQDGEATSPEPSPRPRLDKGKGRATSPAQRDASPVPQARAQTRNHTAKGDDDSVILLDDDDDGPSPLPPPIRTIDDNDDDDDEYEKALERERRVREASKTEPEDSKDSHVDDDLLDTADPEFEEYIIRARARDAAARAAQAAQEEVEAAGLAATSTAEDGPAGTAEGGGGRADIRLARYGSAVSSSASPPPSMSEQNYRIFLTPHFPEPVPPLVANVRMDQKMIHVQNAFIDHARRKGVTLPDDQAERVVLTWKGNKLYSWTTGQSLGIRPDRSGRFNDDGSSSVMGLSGFLSGGLHLEIWTPPLYEAFLAEQERQRKRNLGEVVAEDLVSSDEDEGPLDGDTGPGGGGGGGDNNAHAGAAGGGGPGGGATGAAQQQRVRLVLKSQDYEKLNITAYGDTKMAILVAAFREQRQIALDKSVAIYWDGERLDKDSTVADAEMEDMDTVEVYVR